MSHPDYEYHAMMAQTWDLFRGDTSKWEDRSFYFEFILENGQPVLDVGCGTGRLLLDFMSQGVDIDGVDISPEMLAICRKKAGEMGMSPRLYENSMESMKLPRRYQTIIVPSSSFQLVLEPANARRAILNLFEHLLAGGSLVMPFMQVWNRSEPSESDWQLTGEKIRPEDGATVRRWSKSRYDPTTPLEHTEDRYELILDGKTVASESHVRSPATREYTQGQALELYRMAGFAEISVYKGFTRLPAVAEDPIFTIAGKKPG
ncbi:MAG TPA: class I SAM-dependent methyltransferase [Anaerolineales bacterium]